MFRSVRAAATTAIAGAVLGLLLTPPMASVWAYDPPGTPWASMHWVERTFGPPLESMGALSFGWSELGPYEVYGKGFFLVYLSMLPMMRLVHDRYRAGGGSSRWELWTWRVMWVSLIVAAVADFLSYWGVSVPGPVGETSWGGGFGVELLASAVLLASTTVYGVVSLLVGVVPVWTSIALISVIPLAIITLATVVAYIPNGYAVPLSIVWAAYGVAVLARRPEPAASPAS